MRVMLIGRADALVGKKLKSAPEEFSDVRKFLTEIWAHFGYERRRS
jgi:hypothetical protein